MSGEKRGRPSPGAGGGVAAAAKPPRPPSADSLATAYSPPGLSAHPLGFRSDAEGGRATSGFTSAASTPADLTDDEEDWLGMRRDDPEPRAPPET